MVGQNKTGLSEAPNPVWSKGIGFPDGLTLRELEAFPSLGLAGLLALFLAGITGQEIVFTKCIAKIGIGFEEGTGDPELDRADLAAHTTAGGADRGIVLIGHVCCLKGMENFVLERKSPEVFLEGALVDGDLSGAGHKSDAGGCGLATTGG